MELALNSNSFKLTDYLYKHEKSKRPMMKRLVKRVKCSNKMLYFNKWFEKEHDYCLPIQKINNSIIEDNDKDCVNNTTSSRSENPLSVNPKIVTNLEKINVTDKLSSCSLYAIDVTTKLLKDALLESKMEQLNYEQSTVISNDCINSSYNSAYNNQPNYNQNDTTMRLNSENIIQKIDDKIEKSCISRKSTPPKLFSPMDIDGDIIKLFPTLDFSTEHNLNEKLENNESKEMDINKIISPLNTDEIKSETMFSLSSSSPDTVSKVSLSVQQEDVVKHKCIDNTSQPKSSNDSQPVSAVGSKNMIDSEFVSNQYINIFNRYQGKSKEQIIEQVENPGPLLLSDLLCGSKPKTIISPYTHRHLKPYIFRDPVTKPLWLQLLTELKEHFRKKNRLTKFIEIETIDYSYVRAKHIQSLNALAREFFWPGIDLSESLLYPDFSVIALYKNLIIGFGFMVPDISTNENYITFLFTRPYWTNCGIAKFMIYHLIQTCMNRDITLHVSPNNPAMILYQQFGFKIEEFVQNFYENYIPAESEMSKHALFLRLRSTLQSK
ncbi:Acyl-CoA N-acyltransferase,GNAT domain [Cinara cedri]|uniref:Acyl-CoA N-acyltransferase,GNAT domain n=1 Tax=Cinara cedri TaxID=506608 RepID=A0A5E4NK29_9HEMI|nr:Acyl-CoA N-acyltransferase,GNAT domain [Cinara cedri]